MPETVVYRTKEFRVILDLNTGRPHLVMLYNNKGKRNKYRSILDFEPPLYRKWLNFLDNVLLDLGPAIFSIHLGKYQSVDSYHSHLFVPVKIYVSMAVKHNAPINLDLYGWQTKALQDGKRYQRADLKNIYRSQPHPRSIPSLPFGYEIKFHSNQPRIAFYRPHGIEKLPELIQAMTMFVKYYNLHEHTNLQNIF